MSWDTPQSELDKLWARKMRGRQVGTNSMGAVKPASFVRVVDEVQRQNDPAYHAAPFDSEKASRVGKRKTATATQQPLAAAAPRHRRTKKTKKSRTKSSSYSDDNSSDSDNSSEEDDDMHVDREGHFDKLKKEKYRQPIETWQLSQVEEQMRKYTQKQREELIRLKLRREEYETFLLQQREARLKEAEAKKKAREEQQQRRKLQQQQQQQQIEELPKEQGGNNDGEKQKDDNE